MPTNFQLKTSEQDAATSPKSGILGTLKKLWPVMRPELPKLLFALAAILLNSGLTIWTPIIIGHAVDRAILSHQFSRIWPYAYGLAALYVGMMISAYFQTRVMGAVGQNVLFRLRGLVFAKLSELPLAFFSQNKTGDLISRINNDTDKLNQFFSRSVMQFVGNAFVIVGAGIAMLVVNQKLGGLALLPALFLLIFAQFSAAWVKRQNFKSLQSLGNLSAEIQESLHNFKVIIAFNRRDYFRQRFQEVNEANYQAAISAGIANNTYVPIFGLASNIGQLIVITYGLYLISIGQFSLGLLISYLAYISRFYDPLRQMASLWADLQSALAGWDRIAEILAMKSDLAVLPAGKKSGDHLLEFKRVSFGYVSGNPVLKKISFKLDAGKTYALVGPTGGGKTTTASLMARLFDPTEGEVLIHGQDIRSFTPEARAEEIGFILQEPFLFSGSVAENITYGNPRYERLSEKDLLTVLQQESLAELLGRFEDGLKTEITSAAESISLGQKQLIAFMRAVLRHPKLLILDEATANIDTVTEQQLETILAKLPKTTTRVIIAHRLNTIENADEIFFVNGGQITEAGSLKHAIELLAEGVRAS